MFQLNKYTHWKTSAGPLLHPFSAPCTSAPHGSLQTWYALASVTQAFPWLLASTDVSPLPQDEPSHTDPALLGPPAGQKEGQ